jgi:hypothetical protein
MDDPTHIPSPLPPPSNHLLSPSQGLEPRNHIPAVVDSDLDVPPRSTDVIAFVSQAQGRDLLTPPYAPTQSSERVEEYSNEEKPSNGEICPQGPAI